MATEKMFKYSASFEPQDQQIGSEGIISIMPENYFLYLSTIEKGLDGEIGFIPSSSIIAANELIPESRVLSVMHTLCTLHALNTLVKTRIHCIKIKRLIFISFFQPYLCSICVQKNSFLWIEMLQFNYILFYLKVYIERIVNRYSSSFVNAIGLPFLQLLFLSGIIYLYPLDILQSFNSLIFTSK